MHGALRVNLRYAAIRAVHDPLLEFAPHDKEGAHRQIQIQPYAPDVHSMSSLRSIHFNTGQKFIIDEPACFA